MWNYSLYGLHISANRPLPGLRCPASQNTANIVFNLSGPQVGVDRFKRFPAKVGIFPSKLAESSEPSLTAHTDPQGYTRLRFSQSREFVEFEVNPGATRVQVWWSEHAALGDVTAILVGPVMGYVLRLRGITCLHGSVVALNDRAVVFLGSKGIGKSTIAAAFARHGNAILSDDLAVLHDTETGFMAHPGYPYLRLNNDAAQALHRGSEPLRRLSPYIAKYVAKTHAVPEKGQWRFHNEPLPVSAAYLLVRKDPLEVVPTTVEITPQDALIVLFSHRYPSSISNRSRDSAAFKAMGKLASEIPVRAVHHRGGFSQLEQLREVIVDDLQTLST
jgi:hypothetical protein